MHSHFHRNGSQNLPKLLHRACFAKSSEKTTFVSSKILRYSTKPNTQKCLEGNFPGDWPVASPVLNPLDDSAWKYTLAKLDCIKHMTLAKFLTRLTKIQDKMPQQLVRAACLSFEKGCRAVVKKRCERFELN
jgi:hypothetical protein